MDLAFDPLEADEGVELREQLVERAFVVLRGGGRCLFGLGCRGGGARRRVAGGRRGDT